MKGSSPCAALPSDGAAPLLLLPEACRAPKCARTPALPVVALPPGRQVMIALPEGMRLIKGWQALSEVIVPPTSGMAERAVIMSVAFTVPFQDRPRVRCRVVCDHDRPDPDETEASSPRLVTVGGFAVALTIARLAKAGSGAALQWFAIGRTAKTA